MKTNWYVKKAEINRLKGPKTSTTNNYQNSPEAFNKYFSSITENNTHDIRFNNKQGYNINKNPKYYLSKLFHKPFSNTRVRTLIVATIYLQLIQNRYMFRSFTVLQCSHHHCVQPVASDVEVVGYLQQRLLC